jgi:hypothetical protein
MRKDMAQLLVEHPRHNAGELYREHRRKANRDPEEAPTKQGMRRPYKERKEFGEYFPPIMGCLRKNVGRPWDKVFSELSASLHGGGAVIDHVKLHVTRDFVTLNPVWQDGVACYPPGFGISFRDDPTPITRRRNDGFYVDQQGILRQAPLEKSRKRPKTTSTGTPADGASCYYKMDSVWYRVWFKALPTPGADQNPVFDLVLKDWLRCRHYPGNRYSGAEYRWEAAGDRYGTRRQVFAHRREQVSSRVIRRERLDQGE